MCILQNIVTAYEKKDVIPGKWMLYQEKTKHFLLL